MSNTGETAPTPIDPDEAFAMKQSTELEVRGFVVYCGPYQATWVGREFPPEIYALVLHRTEHDALLAKINSREKIQNSPKCHTTLPEGYIVGHSRIRIADTREAALKATIQAGIEGRKAQ